jgi:hypothetical protein
MGYGAFPYNAQQETDTVKRGRRMVRRTRPDETESLPEGFVFSLIMQSTLIVIIVKNYLLLFYSYYKLIKILRTNIQFFSCNRNNCHGQCP